MGFMKKDLTKQLAGLKGMLKKKICRGTVFMTAAVLCAALALGGKDGAAFSRDVPELTAWWGVMYPDFCFGRAICEEEEASQEEGEEPEIRFAFWIAEVWKSLR